MVWRRQVAFLALIILIFFGWRVRWRGGGGGCSRSGSSCFMLHIWTVITALGFAIRWPLLGYVSHLIEWHNCTSFMNPEQETLHSSVYNYLTGTLAWDCWPPVHVNKWIYLSSVEQSRVRNVISSDCPSIVFCHGCSFVQYSTAYFKCSVPN
jgi:hypothetical protein